MSTLAISAVFRHSASKGSARLVLLAMADEANDEGLLTAYRRSHSHLAAKANVDTGTVHRAVKVLVELDELDVLATGSGRTPTDYRLVLPGLIGTEPEGRQPAPPAPAPRLPRGRELPTQGARDAPPITPLLPGVTPSPPTPTRVDPLVGFEAFWQLYPRRTAKGAARTAWPAAVKAAGGTYQPILDGAARYAHDPNRSPQYTAHPATWLRAERWNDEPEPPRNGARPASTTRISPTDDALMRDQPINDPEAF